MGRRLFLSGVVLFVLTLSFVVVVKADSLTWSQTYGGTGSDIPHSLITTADGGYVLAGETGSFGAGHKDFWLIKTDISGNVEWNQTYGGLGYERAYGLVATSDGGYALIGDNLLVKTDEFGDMEWNQTYGGGSTDFVLSLVEVSDGGYAIAGFTYSFGAGGQDCWLVKTDAAGNAEWNQTYGGAGDDRAHTLIKADDGGYVLAGTTRSYGAGNFDFWVVKTDANGTMQWNQTYGKTTYEYGYSIVKTFDEGYAIAGFTGYTDSIEGEKYDFWLVKIDEFGAMQWNQTYGGEGDDRVYSLVATSDGGYLLVGGTMSFGAGNMDSWLVKTDSMGNMEWNRTYGGAGADAARSVVETDDGGYAFVGETGSFGAGGSDFWLVKTDETGYVPEYTSWFIPSLLLIATTAIIIYKKKTTTTR